MPYWATSTTLLCIYNKNMHGSADWCHMPLGTGQFIQMSTDTCLLHQGLQAETLSAALPSMQLCTDAKVQKSYLT